MTTQIRLIADALTRYLDEAGITRAEDRISALRRHYSRTWLDMLTAARLNAGFSVFDIDEAIDMLMTQLESQP